MFVLSYQNYFYRTRKSGIDSKNGTTQVMKPFSESRFLQHVRMLGLICGQDRLGQAVQAEKSPEISVESTESTESPQSTDSECDID